MVGAIISSPSPQSVRHPVKPICGPGGHQFHRIWIRLDVHLSWVECVSPYSWGRQSTWVRRRMRSNKNRRWKRLGWSGEQRTATNNTAEYKNKSRLDLHKYLHHTNHAIRSMPGFPFGQIIVSSYIHTYLENSSPSLSLYPLPTSFLVHFIMYNWLSSAAADGNSAAAGAANTTERPTTGRPDLRRITWARPKSLWWMRRYF